MNFIEKDLEDIIYNTTQSQIRGRGLDCLLHDSLYRQVSLSGYGRADLIGVSYSKKNGGMKRRFEITIYECKQDKVDVNTLMQAAGYLGAASDIVETINKNVDLTNTEFIYKIVLIGKSICTSTNLCFLAQCIPNISVYLYRYEFDGIFFDKIRGYAKSVDLTDYAADFLNEWIEYFNVHKHMNNPSTVSMETDLDF